MKLILKLVYARFKDLQAFLLVMSISGRETNFENFRNLMNNTGSSFNIINLTERWCSDTEMNNGFCSNINSYDTIPFKRKTAKIRRSIRLYVKTELMYKTWKEFSPSDKDKEILTFEIISKRKQKCFIFLLLQTS